MAEPTSSTIAVAAATAGVGLATFMPGLDGNALFGAVVGGAVVALNKKDLHAWQRIIGLLVSVGSGYISAAEIVAQSPISKSGPAGFVGAIIVVPIALKLLEQIDKTDFSAFAPDWWKRGKGD